MEDGPLEVCHSTPQPREGGRATGLATPPLICHQTLVDVSSEQEASGCLKVGLPLEATPDL